MLERETKKEAQRVTKLRPKQAKPISCKFCLFGSFRTSKAYSQHLQRDHLPTTGSHKDFFQFVPLKMGGRKQLKLIKALFDDDALKKKVGGKYLERSTDYIKKVLAEQNLPQRKSQYHRLLGLVLTAQGPEYFANLNANSSVGFRRIGYAYYDESFATAMFRESLSNHGRFRTTYSAFVGRTCAAGNPLWSLMHRPADGLWWTSVAEDIITSPRINDMIADLLQECFLHGEMQHLSMDGTIRCARRVKGQADYLEKAAVRNQALFGDDVALRRILTVRGRTGAVIGMWPVRSEASEEVARVFLDHLGEEHRESCVSIACDDPNHKLFNQLLGVFKNLKFLVLDPVHLVIVYVRCHGGKETPGSSFLRRIMARFNRVDTSTSADFWGPVYNGAQVQPPSQTNLFFARFIGACSLEAETANKVFHDFEDDKPYASTSQFVLALAALTKLYSDEVRCKSCMKGKLLCEVLESAAAPDRLHWYFNNTRLRHAVESRSLSLLASGSASNEALHSEINNWFKNQPELYMSTLKIQLRLNWIAKLATHSIAMYGSLARQNRQDVLLQAWLGQWEFGKDAWDSWVTSTSCLPLKDESRVVKCSPIVSFRLDADYR